jgi:hypothetical protein
MFWETTNNKPPGPIIMTNGTSNQIGLIRASNFIFIFFVFHFGQVGGLAFIQKRDVMSPSS